ncbi:FKBP-type peptidyl-prolyl cis-trans isomerase [Demequina zhanjiangensis]|uniref:Peptidyl-prolyl cis-trans isomerase n=1 Tax=Demequina zhanjiangensis TaxID=3051659 RepID=A0ABT8G490_9MICO|nr:FKBP-type peptidyl-prolyl cis-trans isomerase [Demequina sp. SYSU T00b26]MDN4473968.1 FKBP-type peptidyl-prolyl cis-trans isomerase [Demequina sp. SYSU T00b26]
MTLPVITRDATGAPSIDFTGTEMPEGLVVEVLESGDGPAVVEGQHITVHYSGWLWDGAKFDSSFDRGESITFPIAYGALIDGWVDGVVGQPVGSKLLLVVPPESGYGFRPMGPIPAGSTLVFVIDVLEAR